MNATDLSATLSNSISLGSILILVALGLAITFGVMGVINMAHGEMLMLGAYTALVITDPRCHIGLNIFAAMPASFLVVGFIGYLMEVSLIRFLYKRPLDTLLATWGVGMILQQVILLGFGADLKPMHLPAVLGGHWDVGQLTIPVYRIFIVGVMLLCLLAVYLWFYRTSFGLKIRAVVQNRPMASALGINTRWVDSLTFAFSSGLAGVAGVMLAHLYTIKYNMGELVHRRVVHGGHPGRHGTAHGNHRQRRHDWHGRQRHGESPRQRFAGESGGIAGGDYVYRNPSLRPIRHEGAEL